MAIWRPVFLFVFVPTVSGRRPRLPMPSLQLWNIAVLVAMPLRPPGGRYLERLLHALCLRLCDGACSRWRGLRVAFAHSPDLGVGLQEERRH